jgi:hypothetical protein
MTTSYRNKTTYSECIFHDEQDFIEDTGMGCHVTRFKEFRVTSFLFSIQIMKYRELDAQGICVTLICHCLEVEVPVPIVNANVAVAEAAPTSMYTKMKWLKEYSIYTHFIKK